MKKLYLLILILFMLAAGRVTAQMEMVKDINTISRTDKSSDPDNTCRIGNTLYFVANDPVHGRELWVSDGSDAGTVMLKDIKPGIETSDPLDLTNINGTLYFSANDALNGREIWKSDGTPAGTVLVKDINPGSEGSNPTWFTDYNGVVLFQAYQPATGDELWKSDGTEAGTVMVKDTYPGTENGSPSDLICFNGSVFFKARDYDHGIELWKTDGTEGGTEVLKDIYPGRESSDPHSFFLFRDKLFFVAQNEESGVELWRTDGTSEGTILLKDINTDAGGGSDPGNFVLMNNTLYFTATACNCWGEQGKEIWKSDGTSENTMVITDVNPGMENSNPYNLTVMGDVIYFVANDGSSGPELWKTHGNSPIYDDDLMRYNFDCELVQNINTAGGSYPENLNTFGGFLYFFADDGANGRELWKSDGTANGTALLTEVIAGPGDGSPQDIFLMNNTLFFTANDGFHGRELWKSDGTPGGTSLVAEVVTGGGDGALQNFIVVNNTLFFSADDGLNGRELWKSDGTPGGISMVRDIYIIEGTQGSNPSAITVADNYFYFNANDGEHGSELWKSDGTGAGTVLVKDVWTGGANSNLGYLTMMNNNLYFSAEDGSHGPELWMSDGSSGITSMVRDICPGDHGSYPEYLININGTLLFSAFNNVLNPPESTELWKSDGTTNGTVMVKDIYPGFLETSSPTYLTNLNGVLYFSAKDNRGWELWRSDGTESGTYIVKDILTVGSSEPRQLVAVNNTLFFTSEDGVNGRELWKTDGTLAGTVMVKNIGEGESNSGDPQNLYNAGGILYFSAGDYGADGTSGWELWKSDGTEQGTVLVKDIFPGPQSSNPEMFLLVNNVLFFRVDNGLNGKELWMSNGTPDGTVMVKDIMPGSGGSDPDNFLSYNGKLYFFANDGINGRELWKSNGTEAGTKIASEFTPGSGDGNIQNGVLMGNVIYFSAVDQSTGRELWKFTINEPPASVTTEITATVFCQGSPIDIPYTIDGTFNEGNIFTAQLSDATGNFTNPVNMGTLTSTLAGTIPAIIPANQEPGTGYRIRIISSDPETIGEDNGSDLTINSLPTVSCPANIKLNTDAGMCGALVTYPEATVTGSPAPVVTYSMTSGSLFPLGITIVTVTASNTCGTTTGTFTVTIEDKTAPVVVCQNATAVLDNSGNGTLTVEQVDNGSTDACGIKSMVLSRTSFSCADIASNPNQVTLTVTDIHGNVSTCVASVTVLGENSSACSGTHYFDYTILGIKEVKLGENNFVQTGNVGATSANGHVIIGKNGVVNPGYVKAKKITVHPSAEVPNKFYEPVVVTLPEMKFNTSNTKNLKSLTVKNNTTVTKTDNYKEVVIGENCNVTFNRGTIFGTIKIGKGSKVTFNADGTGTLNVGSLELEEGTSSKKTSLIFTTDMSVKVKDYVVIGKSSVVNPDDYAVVFYIGSNENGNGHHGDQGQGDEGHGNEFLVDGGKTVVNASVYTPTGTIKVEGDEHKTTEMNGTFIAYKIESKGEEIYWNSSAVGFKAGTISSDEGEITNEIVSPASDLLVYPNPATGPVTFRFSVEQSGMASIDIYSSTGQMVQRAWEGNVKGGECQIVTVENQLAKGLYFVRMRSGSQVRSARLIVADR